MREKQIGLEIKQEVGTVGYFLNRNFEEGGGGGRTRIYGKRGPQGVSMHQKTIFKCVLTNCL